MESYSVLRIGLFSLFETSHKYDTLTLHGISLGWHNTCEDCSVFDCDDAVFVLVNA